MTATKAEVEAARMALHNIPPGRPEEGLCCRRDAVDVLAVVEPLMRERLAQEVEAADVIGDNPAWRSVADQLTAIHARIVRGDAS